MKNLYLKIYKAQAVSRADYLRLLAEEIERCGRSDKTFDTIVISLGSLQEVPLEQVDEPDKNMVLEWPAKASMCEVVG